MRRLKIQRVKSVPPIPTISIVIPNVQLSIFIELPPDDIDQIQITLIRIRERQLVAVSRKERSLEKNDVRLREDFSLER